MKASEQQETSWDDVPDDIRKTYDRLGIPEAEQKFLSGVKAQYESEVVYGSLQEDLAKQGVIFTDTDSALRDHPELFREYFGTIIPSYDNKFAALNSAVWSGGSFIYVPPGVNIEFPMQAYFRINSENMGQFERTLIIVDEGASIHYVEGCTAPTYSSNSLHSAVVEILVKKGGRCRYTTIQNWSNNVYNLVTKRAMAYKDALMEWADASLQWTVGGLGAKLAHIHQHVTLDGRGADAQVNGVTFATDRQLISYYTQQTHNAPDTHSDLLYKEVLRDRAKIVWRGMIKVDEVAQKTDGYQRSDALMLSADARCDSIPGLEIEADDVRCTHGATTGRVDDEQIFYTMSRGMTKFEAMHMIVEGFFHQVYDRIPVEVVRETLSQAVERKLGMGD
ncbi:UNVERIFIED_CONTAM: hypothetical protein GTU68_007616 [Idotea baltica]|nr:hypothetical protein [Idotea baltica]